MGILGFSQKISKGVNMTDEEFELTIGKLTILKLFLTVRYHRYVDALIERLTSDYLERRHGPWEEE